MPRAKTALVTIANGAAESTSVRTESDTIVGLYMPAGWTAAEIGFQASRDDSAFSDVMDAAGARLQVQGTAGEYVPVDPVPLMGIKHLKLESVDGAGVAVNQGAQRDIHVAYRQIQSVS